METKYVMIKESIVGNSRRWQGKEENILLMDDLDAAKDNIYHPDWPQSDTDIFAYIYMRYGPGEYQLQPWALGNGPPFQPVFWEGEIVEHDSGRVDVIELESRIHEYPDEIERSKKIESDGSIGWEKLQELHRRVPSDVKDDIDDLYTASDDTIFTDNYDDTDTGTGGSGVFG